MDLCVCSSIRQSVWSSVIYVVLKCNHFHFIIDKIRHLKQNCICVWWSICTHSVFTALISEEVPSWVHCSMKRELHRHFPINIVGSLYFFFVILGFNVGRSAGGRSTVREINRDACHFPGFPVLQSLLPKHTNVPALYFLLMALFLQQPVTELPENLQVSAPGISSRCNQGCQVGII